MAHAGEGGEGEGGPTIGEYYGGRNADNERHGQGWAVLPNGDIYEGRYSRGKRNGMGTYVFRNGSRYIGEWRRGMKYGKGVFYYPDGSRYEGQWRYDLRHGFGVYYYINGDMYEGSWKKGLRHGLGTYTYINSGTKFMGTWKDGQMEGPGQLIHPKYRFHGSWSQNLPFGKGCYSFQLTCIQHGNYLHVKDPEFEVGEGGEEATVPEEPEAPEEGAVLMKPGIIPLWRATHITPYSPDLLPPEPVPIEIVESKESILPEEETITESEGEGADMKDWMMALLAYGKIEGEGGEGEAWGEGKGEGYQGVKYDMDWEEVQKLTDGKMRPISVDSLHMTDDERKKILAEHEDKPDLPRVTPPQSVKDD